MKSLKNKIAEILNSRNITPYRLSKQLGIPAQTVYAWCNNKSNPSQKHLISLMEILDVQLEEILEVGNEK